MEFEPLILELGVNKIKSERGKVGRKQSRVRELGDAEKRKLGFCFGAKLAMVFYVLLVYHLYYLSKIPQMPIRITDESIKNYHLIQSLYILGPK